jgi:thiamine-monophosphate kinase
MENVMNPASEDAFLELIDSHFTLSNPHVKLGRGDDCCILSNESDLCVSSDLFLEDVHFRRSYFSPGDIGYKALAVNLSDIAGMGARPIAFNMDLMIPDGLPDGFWDEFFSSMSALARQNDLVLAGGDLSRADKLGVNITIFGAGGSKGRFIERRKAAVGDGVFVCGDLGLARVGMLAMEEMGEAAKEAYPAACRAHLRPKMKLMIASLLTAAGTSSLMDVSDGLARDLPRLVTPEQGVDIEISEDMIPAEVVRYCEEKGLDPVETLVLGGEDYALLGTADFETGFKVRSVPGVQMLGKVSGTPGVRVNGKDFSTSGFDHFA